MPAGIDAEHVSGPEIGMKAKGGRDCNIHPFLPIRSWVPMALCRRALSGLIGRF